MRAVDVACCNGDARRDDVSEEATGVVDDRPANGECAGRDDWSEITPELGRGSCNQELPVGEARKV